MNPIYIEYYIHDKVDCYKIDLPWSKYGKQTIVLCEVSEGFDKAARLAYEIVLDHLLRSIKDGEIQNK